MLLADLWRRWGEPIAVDISKSPGRSVGRVLGKRTIIVLHMVENLPSAERLKDMEPARSLDQSGKGEGLLSCGCCILKSAQAVRIAVSQALQAILQRLKALHVAIVS